MSISALIVVEWMATPTCIMASHHVIVEDIELFQTIKIVNEKSVAPVMVYTSNESQGLGRSA